MGLGGFDGLGRQRCRGLFAFWGIFRPQIVNPSIILL